MEEVIFVLMYYIVQIVYVFKRKLFPGAQSRCGSRTRPQRALHHHMTVA